jgi:methionyl-tRNA formyltransferase
VFGKVTVAAEQTLWRVLPALLAGTRRACRTISQGQLFRRPQARGRPHRLAKPAAAGLQPVRAVAPPYPGAFTDIGGRRFVARAPRGGAPPRDAACARRPARRIMCDRRLRRWPRYAFSSWEQRDGSETVVTPAVFRSHHSSRHSETKKVLLGVNGFIGHHLSKRILETTDWQSTAWTCSPTAWAIW